MNQELLEILFKHYTGNSEDLPVLDVDKCLKEVSDYLTKHGCHCELQEYKIQDTAGRTVSHYNLISFNPPVKNTKTKYVIFQGHIDTVHVKGEYSYSITKDEVIGRGAEDMKGSLAGMIDAFVKVYGKKSEYQPMLVITCDEEANGFQGIYNFIKFLKQSGAPEAVFCINGEPNNFTVSSLMRGVMMFDIQKTGTDGHSFIATMPSLAEEGIRLLRKIDLFLGVARTIGDKIMGQTIGALTMIHTGTRPNKLPDKFKVHFHLRTIQSGPFYLPLYKKIVGDYAEKTGYEVNIRNYDPCRITIPSPFNKKFNGMKETTFDAFSEASILNVDGGITTVICGVGDLMHAHGDPKNEILALKEIDRYSEFLQKFITGSSKSLEAVKTLHTQ